MKKIISSLLIVAILFTLSSCSIKNFSDEKTPTEIQLTVENINDYFNINGYSDGYNESHYRDFMGFDKYTCWCVMHISVEKMYDFEIKEPIELKFKILHVNWDSISETKSENYQTYAYITIPTSGIINKTYSCSTKTYFSQASSMPNPHLETVVGTIYVYE